MTKKILLAASLLFLMTQCGGSGSSSGDDFFFTQAKLVAPVVTPTVSSAIVHARANTTWNYGNIMYELFDLLRDYDNARDQGVIGISNMYKTMYQTSDFYASEIGSCTAITAQVVVSPYDVGTRNTYNCAGTQNSNNNYFAMDTTDPNIKKALMTWHVSHSAEEYGVIEGNFNETTKDILVDLAAYCDYPDTNDYSQRLYISGNSTTHTFTLKSMKYNSGTGGYSLSLVGYGVSKGEGQKFLFKVQDSDNVLTPKYFCFDAEATEAELEAMVTQTGSDTAPAGCEAYQSAVDALTMYTSSDVPKALAEFTNSSLALTYN